MRHLVELLRSPFGASRRHPIPLRHVIAPLASAHEQLEVVTGSANNVDGDVVTFTLDDTAAEPVVTVGHELAAPSSGAASLAATRSMYWNLWREPIEVAEFSLQTGRFRHRFPTVTIEGATEVRVGRDRVLTTVHFTLADAQIEMCWPSDRPPADVLADFEPRTT